MPGILLSEEMESGVGSNKKHSKTPTPKKIKRKMQNGDAEELDFEQATKLNGLVNEDLNNNDQKTPKLKKKKKKQLAENESSFETAEQCTEEQDISDAPTSKKLKKKKQKKDLEESETQQDAAEPEINGEKSGKKAKTKKNSKKVKENVDSEDSGAPAAKKRKTEPEINGMKEESKTEEEEINLEKIEGDFSKFPISKETIANLQAKGVTYLFPIQSKTFHTAYSGKDVVVQARTGTGKTFSFAIPLIERLIENKEPLANGRPPRVLILTPTRELAIQIMNEIRSLSKKLKTCCFYGGSPYQQQVFAIRTGLDILVGTPGRIRDLIQNYKLNLTALEHVVLDEVDMMLEMGFAEQVEEILSVRYKPDPEQNPQTLLFSATCPDWMYNVAKKIYEKGIRKD
ncbi:unnamed protein product [Staurois parvus]|uniref:Helicase ATP-binding domain-containing protein n=1 Tax=Staurois parvus TaxID=386267 RepID=A0ABN9BJD9_9NEOB|nr:unnamed protein product [Staurois parvus]